MHNIWEFFLQTLDASLLCAGLLLLKRLFLDKLSPRWQYGIWSLLALRLLIPVGLFGTYLVPSLAVTLEWGKAMAEKHLTSAYSAPYLPLHITAPLPILQGMPVSATDWLFALYAAGVCFFLLRTLFGYVRLRLLLQNGTEPDEAQQSVLEHVCSLYHLSSCRMVAVPNLPSSFVCGMLSPVLVVPSGEVLDEKVLLHELLHKRSFDPLQSVFWSVLRALHWCNPLLLYAIRRIGNDMESLCDQRVLELLEGEDRRDYGRILLSMTNERYPRAPGTSSLSNGGTNIARRIEAIVRFQTYPKGMALVSVCIVVLLLSASTIGIHPAEFTKTSFRTPPKPDSATWHQQMASARIRRCSTMAGAVDTFAKAILLQNPVYLAAVTPHVEQERWMEQWEQGVFTLSLPALPLSSHDTQYSLYNLHSLADTGNYEGLLVFQLEQLGNDGTSQTTLCTLPIRLKNQHGWTVQAQGVFQTIPPSPTQANDGNIALLPSMTYLAKGASGSIRLQEQLICNVNNQSPSSSQFGTMFVTSPSFDPIPKPDADFERTWYNTSFTYTFTGSEEERAAIHSVGFCYAPIFSNEEIPDFSGNGQLMSGNISSNSSTGTGSIHEVLYEDKTWDGILTNGGGGTTLDWKRLDKDLPLGYAVQIYFNGEPREVIKLLREVPS